MKPDQRLHFRTGLKNQRCSMPESHLCCPHTEVGLIIFRRRIIDSETVASNLSGLIPDKRKHSLSCIESRGCVFCLRKRNYSMRPEVPQVNSFSSSTRNSAKPRYFVHTNIYPDRVYYQCRRVGYGH